MVSVEGLGLQVLSSQVNGQAIGILEAPLTFLVTRITIDSEADVDTGLATGVRHDRRRDGAERMM
jgi:hypothetical protein